jgi:hypothetical protein
MTTTVALIESKYTKDGSPVLCLKHFKIEEGQSLESTVVRGRRCNIEGKTFIRDVAMECMVFNVQALAGWHQSLFTDPGNRPAVSGYCYLKDVPALRAHLLVLLANAMQKRAHEWMEKSGLAAGLLLEPDNFVYGDL